MDSFDKPVEQEVPLAFGDVSKFHHSKFVNSLVGTMDSPVVSSNKKVRFVPGTGGRRSAQVIKKALNPVLWLWVMISI